MHCALDLIIVSCSHLHKRPSPSLTLSALPAGVLATVVVGLQWPPLLVGEASLRAPVLLGCTVAVSANPVALGRSGVGKRIVPLPSP